VRGLRRKDEVSVSAYESRLDAGVLLLDGLREYAGEAVPIREQGGDPPAPEITEQSPAEAGHQGILLGTLE